MLCTTKQNSLTIFPFLTNAKINDKTNKNFYFSAIKREFRDLRKYLKDYFIRLTIEIICDSLFHDIQPT